MSSERETALFIPFLLVQIAAVLIILAIVAFRPGPWSVARWAGLLIAIPAAVLLFVARWQLGRSFSVTAQARELVSEGMYSKIQNPIYVFSALMLAGVLISLQRPWLLLIVAILIPVQVVRAHKEAKVLEEKFGDRYREYRIKTWF
jgi:protein-S-isoprenylcysteine O-methyltransferase Ste14